MDGGDDHFILMIPLSQIYSKPNTQKGKEKEEKFFIFF